ncbi:unnamed protein product [Brassica rapa subsp. trilocularis]
MLHPPPIHQSPTRPLHHPSGLLFFFLEHNRSGLHPPHPPPELHGVSKPFGPHNHHNSCHDCYWKISYECNFYGILSFFM